MLLTIDIDWSHLIYNPLDNNLMVPIGMVRIECKMPKRNIKLPNWMPFIIEYMRTHSDNGYQLSITNSSSIVSTWYNLIPISRKTRKGKTALKINNSHKQHQRLILQTISFLLMRNKKKTNIIEYWMNGSCMVHR